MADEQPKQRRGFALLTPERRREISSRGGVAAHKKGSAHEWDTLEAGAAGKLGGAASARKKRSRS